MGRKINVGDPTDYEVFESKQLPPNLKCSRRLATAVLARAIKDLDDFRLGVSTLSNHKPILKWVRDAEMGIDEGGSLIFWANIAFEQSKADYYIDKFKAYRRTYFNS